MTLKENGGGGGGEGLFLTQYNLLQKKNQGWYFKSKTKDRKNLNSEHI